MPIIKKSAKKAFDHKMKEELPQGKDQALAIAYNVQRKNKRKMMAKGGMAMDDEMDASRMAMMPTHDDMRDDSIASRVMKKRKMMAEGGEVDLEENAKEGKNLLDDLNHDALHEESYAEEDALMDLPLGSDEHGDDELDSDDHDMISKIMSKIKSKRKM